jgi:DNA polymerase elongation subunit (family B)
MENGDDNMKQTDLQFQIISWDNYHETNNDDDNEDEDTVTDVFSIRIYGRTIENKSVFMNIKDYTPYFYVEIPHTWKSRKAEIFVDQIRKYVPKRFRGTLIKHNVIKRYRFWEFSDYRQYNFVRLVFNNYFGFKQYERVIRSRKLYNPILSPRPRYYKLYESNIEPMIRFMHIKDIKSSGWVQIKEGKYKKYNDKNSPSHCDINVHAKWSDVEKYDSDHIQKFITASFDIECTSIDGSFPQAHRDGDKIIQIGTTFSYYAEGECFKKHIITLGGCTNIPGIEVESYNTETEVLLAWTKLINRMDPDIITGYNIYGFDFKYMHDRAKKLGCLTRFSRLCRIKSNVTKFVEKTLMSSALGDNRLFYFDILGRVTIDLMKVVQRDYKLTSYKLDNVAAHFIRGDIKTVIPGKHITRILTDSIDGLHPDQYITIYFNDGLSDNKYDDGKKYIIKKISEEKMEYQGENDDEPKKYSVIILKKVINGINVDEDKKNGWKYYWCQAKDDVTPQDIFRFQEEGDKERAIVAKYCVKDCSLCNKLIDKLKIVTNNISMSNVCRVPLSYIFLRGQGVKLFSLVAMKCRLRNHVIPTIRKPFNPNPDDEEQKDTFEGAIVLTPEPGIYRDPIAVLDFASLYPRSIIQKNASHETLVMDPQFDNLEGYVYRDSRFTMNDKAVTRRYAQKEDGSMGIIPEILNDLLDSRSATKTLMKMEKNPFIKNILDGLQLAYKVTANSLYGQIGASTSAICYKDIAASTTAAGRDMIIFAKGLTESFLPLVLRPLLDGDFDKYNEVMNDAFDGKMLELNINAELRKLLTTTKDMLVVVKDDRFIDKKKGHQTRDDFIKYFKDEVLKYATGLDVTPVVIYGDTDSIFINFNIRKRKNGNKEAPIGTELVNAVIQFGILTGLLTNKFMPYPHDLEYEKTFWPFCILTKKKYVGNKYDEDPTKFEQVNMGVVLKRRDNATIVKIACGGIVHKMLNDQNSEAAVDFTREVLSNILKGKYGMDKFVLTKTLRSTYANRSSIVHAVLADRIARRDPGNKPQSNDRIPFLYIIPDKTPKLQGDRVETPDYIIQNDLKIDYLFYITNQIMNPATQFLSLIIKEPEKIFDDYITREVNRRKGAKPLSFYFDKYKDGTSVFDDEEEIDSEEEDNIASNFKMSLDNNEEPVYVQTSKRKTKHNYITKKGPATMGDNGGFAMSLDGDDDDDDEDIEMSNEVMEVKIPKKKSATKPTKKNYIRNKKPAVNTENGGFGLGIV